MLVLVRNAYQRLLEHFRPHPRPWLPSDAAGLDLAVTTFDYGPFAVVVTDPAWPEDPTYPIIVCPPAGYVSKAAAITYAMEFVNHSRPLRFAVGRCKSEAQFKAFTRWEV